MKSNHVGNPTCSKINPWIFIFSTKMVILHQDLPILFFFFFFKKKKTPKQVSKHTVFFTFLSFFFLTLVDIEMQRVSECSLVWSNFDSDLHVSLKISLLHPCCHLISRKRSKYLRVRAILSTNHILKHFGLSSPLQQILLPKRKNRLLPRSQQLVCETGCLVKSILFFVYKKKKSKRKPLLFGHELFSHLLFVAPPVLQTEDLP